MLHLQRATHSKRSGRQHTILSVYSDRLGLRKWGPSLLAALLGFCDDKSRQLLQPCHSSSFHHRVCAYSDVGTQITGSPVPSELLNIAFRFNLIAFGGISVLGLVHVIQANESWRTIAAACRAHNHADGGTYHICQQFNCATAAVMSNDVLSQTLTMFVARVVSSRIHDFAAAYMTPPHTIADIAAVLYLVTGAASVCPISEFLSFLICQL